MEINMISRARRNLYMIRPENGPFSALLRTIFGSVRKQGKK